MCRRLYTTLVITLLASAACVKPLPPTMTPSEIVSYQAADEWTSSLRHYEPGEPDDFPPVILVHGLGANHYNFDYRPEVSLADYLQQHGWDVWVAELPGDPSSVPPEEVTVPVDFDHYAQLDLPAAVDEVRERTGSEQVAWVGHSMGGILLFTALSNQPEKIAAGVVVGSSVTFEHPQGAVKWLRKNRWKPEGDGFIRFDKWSRKSLFMRRWNPAYRRLANRKHLGWPVTLGMARHAISPVSTPLLRQATAWVRAGELVHRDGRSWADEIPADPGVPLLAIGAEHDRIVSPVDVRTTCEQIEGCTYEELEDYGHVDPVTGKTARTEVYPRIEQWLRETISSSDR